MDTREAFPFHPLWALVSLACSLSPELPPSPLQPSGPPLPLLPLLYLPWVLPSLDRWSWLAGCLDVSPGSIESKPLAWRSCCGPCCSAVPAPDPLPCPRGQAHTPPAPYLPFPVLPSVPSPHPPEEFRDLAATRHGPTSLACEYFTCSRALHAPSRQGVLTSQAQSSGPHLSANVPDWRLLPRSSKPVPPAVLWPQYVPPALQEVLVQLVSLHGIHPTPRHCQRFCTHSPMH